MKDIIEDSACGSEFKKAKWKLCGKFPLKEIVEQNKRACREVWRDVFLKKGEQDEFWDMLSIIADDEGHLLLQREASDAIVGAEVFNDGKDMLAEDWYLEIEEESEQA
jgi:hypothetical protein